MRTTMTKNRAILVYGTILILLLQIPAYFLLRQDVEGLLLYMFLMLLLVLTLWRGTVFGLISSLVFIFITGSTLLYTGISGSMTFLNSTFSMQIFFIYGIILLLLILCAGKMHELMKEQENYLKKLQEDVRKYVAIDVETGFDNEARMYISVNEEMRRADRHKHTFVFMVLKIENYRKFQQLYGAKEVQHLWQQLSQRIQQTVRQTDKKFRFREDHIGLLLIDTTDEHMEVIYDKLDQALKNHQLLNEKWVTLRYKTSFFTYHPLKESTFDELLEELEREMKTSAL
ncbi:diguanylate cyclase [Lysinibacillus sp. FSL L8-0312]|uniref:diguanylate cyclase domain-containing protein n=1 Tax=unclassified Lysinibacillus TaxID=2636778 RepID=UPI002330F254|nr:diguanylate cyclase [Lysinibacillus sp. OF-1]WCH46297.1 diguanylate cyclase [Lysinibacillus sp. OF-1]